MTPIYFRYGEHYILGIQPSMLMLDIKLLHSMPQLTPHRVILSPTSHLSSQQLHQQLLVNNRYNLIDEVY
jgi:hypothetical protein